MTDKNLNLIFPQWQGSGKDNRLYYAARAVPGICPDLEFSAVPVPETCELESRRKILGYDVILNQMESAGACIRKNTPETILTIGGDCGTEIMPVSWLNRLHGSRMTLVWLDAHADLNTPDTSPSGHFHGMPLAVLLNLGDAAICGTAFSILTPDQIILAGLRNPDPAETKLAEKMTRVSADQMALSPETLAAAVRQKGNTHIYVHVDLDVLDPKIFPHVGCPEKGGLTPDELLRTLEVLFAEFTVAGLGLTEFTLPGAGRSEARNSLSRVKTLVKLFRPPQSGTEN